jgi:hypothetical protein
VREENAAVSAKIDELQRAIEALGASGGGASKD